MPSDFGNVMLATAAIDATDEATDSKLDIELNLCLGTKSCCGMLVSILSAEILFDETAAGDGANFVLLLLGPKSATASSSQSSVSYELSLE